MPVIHHSANVAHELHESRFVSCVAPAVGRVVLCGWRLEIPERLKGPSHKTNQEEVLLVLGRQLGLTLNGVSSELGEADVTSVLADSQPPNRWRTGCRDRMGDNDRWDLRTNPASDRLG